MYKIAIIIPCFNEEKRLDLTSIEYLIENVNIDLYFANDGSTDNTQHVIDSICNNYNNCFSINYNQNEGKSSTIFKSTNYLLNNFNHDYIGYFDADFSTPADQLLNLVDYLNEYSPKFIFASRINTLNSNIKRKTYRHFIGRIIITIINFKHKLNIYDTQCGCKIFSRDIIKEIGKEKYKTSWLFDIEIFIRLKNKNLLKNGIEYPVKNWKDVDGSKLKLTHFSTILKEISILYSI